MIPLPSFEKLLAAIPVFGLAIAISFDVGFFVAVGPGYFTFFTLSEHLLYAGFALPFAIVLVSLLALGWVVMEQAAKRLPKKYRPPVPVLAALLLFAATALLAAQAYFHGDYRVPIFLILPALSLIAILFLGSAAPVTAALFVLLISLSLVAGHLFAIGLLLGSEMSHQVRLSPNEILNGRIIRMGERGVLFWDPALRRVSIISGKT